MFLEHDYYFFRKTAEKRKYIKEIRVCINCYYEFKIRHPLKYSEWQKLMEQGINDKKSKQNI
jgi:hypothetical protein